MKYQPKRASKRWLEGAPEPVLACYDNGGRSIDRYTVLYGAPFWAPEMGRNVPYLAMNGAPFWPQGFCQHGEMPSINRSALGKKIRFGDLPPDCRHAVKQDCAETEKTCETNDLDRDIEQHEPYQLIIRAIWERGARQAAALAELSRRGLWLSDTQKRQAGLLSESPE